MSELEMDEMLREQAEAFAAESYITETAAALLLQGRGKEAVVEYLDRHPLDGGHYLTLLWHINSFTRGAE